MKKVIVCMVIAVMVLAVITIVVMNTKEDVVEPLPEYITIKDLYIPKEDSEKEYYQDFYGEWLVTYSLENKEALAKHAEHIIIAKIDEVEKQYFDKELNKTITIGKLTVRHVYKGNLENGKQIEFMRDGGIIKLSEFEDSLDKIDAATLDGLTKNQRIEKYGLHKYSQEEKENILIFDGKIDDIPVEKNKTYLIYMNHNEELNKYEFKYSGYGLREVEQTGLTMDYQKIRVKDNKTGKYEYIRTEISEDLLNTTLMDYVFMFLGEIIKNLVK